MRGSDDRSGSLFSYVDLEARVRPDHPLRTIREIANAALADLSKEFGVCTAATGPGTRTVAAIQWRQLADKSAERQRRSWPLVGESVGPN